jgi:hypothetical protein
LVFLTYLVFDTEWQWHWYPVWNVFFFNICQISWKLLTVRFYINCSCFQNATEQAKHILLGWLGNKTCFKEIKHKKAHLKWKLLTPPKWQKNVLNIFRHPRLIEQI